MLVQRGVVETHTDTARRGVESGTVDLIKCDRAACRALKSSEKRQQRTFPRAGRSNNRKQSSARYSERNFVECEFGFFFRAATETEFVHAKPARRPVDGVKPERARTRPQRH